MAEVIGKAVCPECGAVAKVCEDKRKQLYLNCDAGESGGCGIFKYQSKIGQARLKKRFAAFPGEDPVGAASPKEPEPEKVPDVVAKLPVAKPEKRAGFFGRRRAAS